MDFNPSNNWKDVVLSALEANRVNIEFNYKLRKLERSMNQPKSFKVLDRKRIELLKKM